MRSYQVLDPGIFGIHDQHASTARDMIARSPGGVVKLAAIPIPHTAPRQLGNPPRKLADPVLSPLPAARGDIPLDMAQREDARGPADAVGVPLRREDRVDGWRGGVADVGVDVRWQGGVEGVGGAGGERRQQEFRGLVLPEASALWGGGREGMMGDSMGVSHNVHHRS